MTGVGGKSYVQEIRVDGAVMNRPVTLAAGVEHQMQITIDDKAAALTGTVTHGDKPASRVVVLLRPESDALAGGRSVVSEGGSFQLSGIVPGDYRILALPQPARGSLAPDAVARLMNGAQKIRLDPGSSQNLSLALTEAPH